MPESNPIVIQMAMAAEAAPLIASLGLVPEADPIRSRTGAALPIRAYGRAAGDVYVILPGIDPRFVFGQSDPVSARRTEFDDDDAGSEGVDLIGTQPATLTAFVAIERYAPRVVISAGTCGGFAARGGAIGDVYLSQSPVRFHGRRVQIPGFDGYAEGRYPCEDVSAIAKDLGLKLGVVSTGDALDLPAEDAEVIERTGVHCKEMEAAAIAWVCWVTGVPFVAVKSVTDIVDGPHATHDEFLEHLHTASDHLHKQMLRIIERL